MSVAYTTDRHRRRAAGRGGQGAGIGFTDEMTIALADVIDGDGGLLAMHAATLDEISEGRFMMGIGTSVSMPE